jgi:hypothetical protein
MTVSKNYHSLTISNSHRKGFRMRLVIVLALCAVLPLIIEPLPNHTDAGAGASNRLAVNAIAHDSLTTVARTIADAYLGTLSRTLWSEDLSSWLATSGYHGVVDSFQGSDEMRKEFDDYCFMTSLKQDNCRVNYYFLDDGVYTDPRALLQQVTIVDRRTNPTGGLGSKVWDLISDSLTRRFGSPSAVPKASMLGPFDLGPVPYRKTAQFWQDRWRQVVLCEYFDFKEGGRVNFTMLLSRQLALDSLLHHKQNVEGHYDGQWGLNSIRSEICDSIRPMNTPMKKLCGTAPSMERRLADLIECGEFVASAGRTSDSVHLPLYRMALYAFGKTYSPHGNGDGSGPFRDVDTLRRYGIVFGWDPLGGGWGCSDAPVKAICSEYPDSHWGQLAFLILQTSGWCLDQMCNANNGPVVVSKGEEFLRRFPSTGFAPVVLLTIAKGYETNWNVSTCNKESSPYMYDPDLRNDESSRQKSIAVYERILKEYPSSLEARVAKVRLPRLKLGINTGTRDYMFIYD